MSGQLKIDGIVRRLIGEIGFMDGDYLGLVRRNSLKGFIEIIGVGIHVVQAHDPDPLASAFQRQRLIAQNPEAMAVERLGHDVGTVPMVVIAENRDHGSAGQLLQNLGARFGVMSARGPIMPKKRVRDEVAAKNGEIGFLREGKPHRAFYLRLAGVGTKVQVAHQGNAKSMERFRQTPEANADLVDDRSMRFNQKTIQGGSEGYPSRPHQSLAKKSPTIQELGLPRNSTNYSRQLGGQSLGSLQ